MSILWLLILKSYEAFVGSNLLLLFMCFIKTFSSEQIISQKLHLNMFSIACVATMFAFNNFFKFFLIILLNYYLTRFWVFFKYIVHIWVYCCVTGNPPVFIDNKRAYKYCQSFEMCSTYNITVNTCKTIQELFYWSNVLCHARSFHGLP